MTQQPPDHNAKTLREARRLLLERESKKRELDAIDQAILVAVGLADDRPKRPRMSREQLRAMCRAVPECKRPTRKGK